jgi:hypothetical protein
VVRRLVDLLVGAALLVQVTVATPDPSLGHRSSGYDYLDAAVDDHSRLAYVEILGDERAQTCARFWRRAHRWFAVHAITVHRVLTDNGVGYRQPAVRGRAGRHRRAPPAHQALPATDEREGGAVQPHLVGGVGLPAAVPLKYRP